MIVHSARALPQADLWIFACRADHLRDTPIEEVLRTEFPGCEIVSVAAITQGPAATCLLAEPLLRADDELTIGPCDSAGVLAAGAALWSDARFEALIWTFRGHPAVLQDPRMYGWVDVAPDGAVRRVSVKVPISATPLRDHAVVGTFSFRRAADFVAAAKQTISLDRRVRGEFYVDDVMNDVIALGVCTGVLEVARYEAWGTPADYEAYLAAGH